MNKEPYINERRKQIQLAVEKFVSLIRDVNGVIEVALFGSAASDKAVPKDFDLMVFIENTDCISQVSKSIRKIQYLKQIDGFVFKEKEAFIRKPVIVWLNPAQNESISQQWFNELVKMQKT